MEIRPFRPKENLISKIEKRLKLKKRLLKKLKLKICRLSINRLVRSIQMKKKGEKFRSRSSITKRLKKPAEIKQLLNQLLQQHLLLKPFKV
jgi:hypothetical protein